MELENQKFNISPIRIVTPSADTMSRKILVIGLLWPNDASNLPRPSDTGELDISELNRRVQSRLDILRHALNPYDVLRTLVTIPRNKPGVAFELQVTFSGPQSGPPTLFHTLEELPLNEWIATRVLTPGNVYALPNNSPMTPDGGSSPHQDHNVDQAIARDLARDLDGLRRTASEVYKRAKNIPRNPVLLSALRCAREPSEVLGRDYKIGAFYELLNSLNEVASNLPDDASLKANYLDIVAVVLGSVHLSHNYLKNNFFPYIYGSGANRSPVVRSLSGNEKKEINSAIKGLLDEFEKLESQLLKLVERNIQSTTDEERTLVYWKAKHVSDPNSALLDATTIIHRILGINLARTIVEMNKDPDKRSDPQLRLAKAIFLIAQKRLSTNKTSFESIDDKVLLMQSLLVKEYLKQIEALTSGTVLKRPR